MRLRMSVRNRARLNRSSGLSSSNSSSATRYGRCRLMMRLPCREANVIMREEMRRCRQDIARCLDDLCKVSARRVECR